MKWNKLRMKTKRCSYVRANKTLVSKANTRSLSVRTTIPEMIAFALSVKAGDALDWEIVGEKDRKIAKVRKLK